MLQFIECGVPYMLPDKCQYSIGLNALSIGSGSQAFDLNESSI